MVNYTRAFKAIHAIKTRIIALMSSRMKLHYPQRNAGQIILITIKEIGILCNKELDDE